MKKYLTMMLILCCALPLPVQAAGELNPQDSFQVAKAFKLGRDVSTVSSTTKSRTVTSSTRKTCPSSQYIKDGECVSCPSNAKCNGHTFTCKDKYRLKSGACVSVCDGVSCSAGYSPVAKAKSCCCE